MKMKDRNAQLKSALGQMVPKERVEAANGIPKENTTNRQGYAAYELSDESRLITMLNTLKLEPQYYRSENQTMKELRDLIERLALKDPYFVAQAIVYSRCMRDGMRSINHLAAALLSPFISGKDYAKRFYGLFDKKKKKYNTYNKEFLNKEIGGFIANNACNASNFIVKQKTIPVRIEHGRLKNIKIDLYYL